MRLWPLKIWHNNRQEWPLLPTCSKWAHTYVITYIHVLICTYMVGYVNIYPKLLCVYKNKKKFNILGLSFSAHEFMYVFNTNIIMPVLRYAGNKCIHTYVSTYICLFRTCYYFCRYQISQTWFTEKKQNELYRYLVFE